MACLPEGMGRQHTASSPCLQVDGGGGDCGQVPMLAATHCSVWTMDSKVGRAAGSSAQQACIRATYSSYTSSGPAGSSSGGGTSSRLPASTRLAICREAHKRWLSLPRSGSAPASSRGRHTWREVVVGHHWVQGRQGPLPTTPPTHQTPTHLEGVELRAPRQVPSHQLCKGEGKQGGAVMWGWGTGRGGPALPAAPAGALAGRQLAAQQQSTAYRSQTLTVQNDAKAEHVCRQRRHLAPDHLWRHPPAGRASGAEEALRRPTGAGVRWTPAKRPAPGGCLHSAAPFSMHATLPLQHSGRRPGCRALNCLAPQPTWGWLWRAC